MSADSDVFTTSIRFDCLAAAVARYLRGGSDMESLAVAYNNAVLGEKPLAVREDGARVPAEEIAVADVIVRMHPSRYLPREIARECIVALRSAEVRRQPLNHYASTALVAEIQRRREQLGEVIEVSAP